MILGEALNRLRNCSNEAPDELLIIFRNIIVDENHDDVIYPMDVLAGFCKWIPETNELISVDGDTYSLEDEISHYEMMYDKKNDDYFLCVWYE